MRARVAAGLGAVWIGLALGAVAGGGSSRGGPEAEGPERVSYGREIRSILSDRCFACHGPDAQGREAGLALDRFEGATAELESGRRAIVPGDPERSELLARVTSSDPRRRMPPASSDKVVTPQEAELLRRWIEEGASYERHWAFVAPTRSEPPRVRDEPWLRDGLDRFVLARLEAEGLAPAPEAARETLLRRVTFDLTGLPPSPEELDAFLADERPDAYERAVDRLLASPRYGEHMARFWLDAARFGDTHGLHLDNERNLWPWRDWVVDALNRNLPYDRFVVEQLAGDLLPDATLATRVASGFNRNNPTTGEGGLIVEEYLAKYAMDRVDTFGTVFLGLTLNCAQCHDHRYDPLPQRDYYRLLAYFDSLAEAGSDENALAPPPSLRAPDEALSAEIEHATAAARVARERLEGPDEELDAAQAEWEGRMRSALAGRWSVLEPRAARASGGAQFETLPDGSLLVRGANPERDVYELEFDTDLADLRALRLEALTHPENPRGGVGRAYNSNIVLTGVELAWAARGSSAAPRPVRLARARADLSQRGFDVSAALDGDPTSGWAVDARLEDRRAEFHAAEPFGAADGARLFLRLRFESPHVQHALGRLRVSVGADPSLAPVTASPWRSLGPFRARSGDEAFATDHVDPRKLDASADVTHPAAGAAPLAWVERPEFVDGPVHSLGDAENAAVYLWRTLESPDARSLTLALGSDDSLRVWLDGTPLLEKRVARPAAPDQDRVTLELTPGRHELLLAVVNDRGGFAFASRVVEEDLGGLPLELEPLIASAADERSDGDARALRQHFRRHHSPAWRAERVAVEELEATQRQLEGRAPLTMVSADLEQRRATRVLVRGQYDHPGEAVEPGVPGVLHPLPEDASPSRLGLARWVVDPANPLTPRVTVNQHWQRFFGAGLVATPEDFGSQGALPTHPELLDWLALEFVASGWDVKALHRRIVTSATYRQDSRVTPLHLERDPANRFLSRAPRPRLDAEAIRDAALFHAGLLVERLGGRSVKPYQPAGLWEAVAYPSSNTARFVQDQGDGLYRRSLYTFWKRTSPPPSLSTFDAPNREHCVVQRSRTNTPLQALALLNDVQFVEAARALAARVLAESPAGDASERLGAAFRRVTSRRPDAEERQLLLGLLESLRARFAADPDAARALVSVGESTSDPGLDPVELAAWTALANVLLNLDEAITRG